jgi:Protein of unknown function (DUF3237)
VANNAPAPQLVEEFGFYADIDVIVVGPGPFGQRAIATITGGELTGERLRGSLVGAGADWGLIGPDGYVRVDVRTTLRTFDDAHVYFQYAGFIEVTPAFIALNNGEDVSTDFGDQYFFTSLRLETGDERYSWVNHTMFLGQGRLLPGPRVEYRVYRMANA